MEIWCLRIQGLFLQCLRFVQMETKERYKAPGYK